MSPPFVDLVSLAVQGESAFGQVSRDECVAAAREYIQQEWKTIRARHEKGESGSNVVRQLSNAADTLLRGIFDFGSYHVANRRQTLARVSMCALGGYGRGELSPYSDLDVCLLYEGKLDAQLERLNDYLVPFLWDVGFAVGYGIRNVPEAMALAREDVKGLTSFLESRLIAGDNTAFARLKLFVRDWPSGDRSKAYIQLRAREREEALPEEYRDLYRPDPDIKENVGGLRDVHVGLWLLMISRGAMTLDDVAGQGLISPEEHLELVEALDFVWRIRNELHFHAGRAENRLTFANQHHVAKAFGYGGSEHHRIARLMEDYYAAARRLRRFLNIALSICDHPAASDPGDGNVLPQPDYTIQDGELYVGLGDDTWFIENPVRFMEVFWECARFKARLSRPTERLIHRSLDLIGDTFRASDLARRFFVAICNRPFQAGHALRLMANVGVLGRYIPEFAEIQGVIRYEDFHHYPVDEHTLRAVEALAELEHMTGPVAQCLSVAIEDLFDPYVLVLAILFHDVGKAKGEIHVEEGVRLVRRYCERSGMPVEDTERIAFLVQHHLLMTTISQYRDLDDEHIVRSFADTVKTGNRLRSLFLMSYCDLAAVGPGVWNDWKGALLLRLYLKTEKILQGGPRTADGGVWDSPKSQETQAIIRPDLRPFLEEHLRGLGERYFAAFFPQEIALHVQTVKEAQETGLSVHFATDDTTGMSKVVVSTLDRPGLFSKIAGCFVSQLVDVNSAALFTRPDGYVVDCFVVADASGQRPLTHREQAGIERVIEAVLLKGEDVQKYVDQSRRRLFALLQPRVPVHTRIDFDNVASQTHTVIDIQTGDRTGLLYDVTRAMTGAGLDITTARIVTDVRHVRDSFYVTLNGGKVETKEEQTAIQERLHGAIHPRAVVADEGVTS